MTRTDDMVIGDIAKAHGWKQLLQVQWEPEQTVQNRVADEPERVELTQVWRHAEADLTLAIHYDYRLRSYVDLQPVFWKGWEGDVVNGGERGYMSSAHMARAHEVYPAPTEGLAINRRWLMGSIIDQLNT